MEILMMIISQGLGAIENIIFIDFVVKVLGWKEEAHRKSCLVMLFIVLFFFSQFNHFFIPYSFVVVIAADVIAMGLFSRRFLKGQRQTQVFWCLIPCTITIIISTLLIQGLEVLIAEPAFKFLKGTNLLFLGSAILTKFVLYGTLLFIRKMVQGRTIRLTGRHWVMTNGLIITVFFMEYLLFQAILLEDINQNIKIVLALVSLALGMMSIYVCYAVFIISDQNDKVLRYEVSQMQKSEAQRQVQELKQVELRIRCLRHDYKNHCLDMQHLLEEKEYDQLRLYLENLSGRYIKAEIESIQTDNPLIDAVVNRALMRCKDSMTDMTCTITGDISELTGLEAAVILFNLLDNAIEACEKVKEERRIELVIRGECNGYNLFLKNTAAKSVLRGNRYLRTDKKEKDEHGIGHFSVEDAVEEAGGMLEYYEEGKFFCVHVFLPVKQNVPHI